MSTSYHSFEEVNTLIEKADLTPYQQGGSHHFTIAAATTSPSNVISKVCGIYKIVAPILKLVASLPLIPAKWKAAIKTFTDLMDSLCH
jgi:hypothetical protein